MADKNGAGISDAEVHRMLKDAHDKMPESNNKPMIIDGNEVTPADKRPNMQPNKKPSEYPKDHPFNPEYKSLLEKGEAQPANGNGQQGSNAAGANQNENAMARTLPGEESKKTSGNESPDKNRENRESLLNKLVAMLGLSSAEKEHVKADPSVAGTGDKVAPVQVVADAAQRVVGDMDPAKLAMATGVAKKINETGTVFHNDDAKQFHGVPQQRAPEQSLAT